MGMSAKKMRWRRFLFSETEALGAQTHQDDPRHLSTNTKKQIPIHMSPGKGAATTAWTMDTEMIGITPNNSCEPPDNKTRTAAYQPDSCSALNNTGINQERS